MSLHAAESLRPRRRPSSNGSATADEADHVAYQLHTLTSDLGRYFSGATTAHQAFQVLDAMEGRALAAEERAAKAEKVLVAASHALKSYQYGNASTELAASIAEACDELLATERAAA
jgi:hypothetical protein